MMMIIVKIGKVIEMVDIRTVLDETVNETVKIYNDYDLNIFDALEIATKIIKSKYKDFEIVEGD